MGGIIKDNCKVGYLRTVSNNDNKLYKCKCVCGKELFVKKARLHNRLTTHCGCLESDNVIYEDKRFLPYVTKFIKKRTKDGYTFDEKITTDFLWNLLTIKQNKQCSLTGVPLSFDGSYIPSIDRIDSKKGYTPNNLQWVQSKINLMKYSFSNSKFLELCKMVVNYANKSN
ncbi:MAG TPA: hypothetical protein PKD00_01420 [Burkholderiales bacterium]|nr:hypothetical protein [Burkholderiales bacterium]